METSIPKTIEALHNNISWNLSWNDEWILEKQKVYIFIWYLTDHRVSNFKHLHCQLPKNMYNSPEASKLLKSKQRGNLWMLHIQTVTYSKLMTVALPFIKNIKFRTECGNVKINKGSWNHEWILEKQKVYICIWQITVSRISNTFTVNFPKTCTQNITWSVQTAEKQTTWKLKNVPHPNWNVLKTDDSSFAI